MVDVLEITGGRRHRRLLWMTDLHLDAAEANALDEWKEALRSAQVDFVLVTGDTADGGAFPEHLAYIRETVGAPLHFVLGNHDYYGACIDEGKRRARGVAKCVYQTEAAPLPLNDRWTLIGHDGWADGREGDFFNSDVQLLDYQKIPELTYCSRSERYERLGELGKSAAEVLKRQLESLPDQNVLIITHVPPFAGAAMYNDKAAGSQWSPHFVCQAVGRMLEEEAKKHPDRQLIVLCGHAHHGADLQVLPNLRVLTGASKTGKPKLERYILIGDRHGCTE